MQSGGTWDRLLMDLILIHCLKAYYAATKASKLVTVLFTADMEAAHIFEA